jgi:hypothetical protein
MQFLPGQQQPGRSGGILEITSLAKESGLSRPTGMSHLEALTVAHAVSFVLSFLEYHSVAITPCLFLIS